MAFSKGQMAKLAILRKMSMGTAPAQPSPNIATPTTPGTGNVNIPPATTSMKMPQVKAPMAPHSLIPAIPAVNTPPKKFKIKF